MNSIHIISCKSHNFQLTAKLNVRWFICESFAFPPKHPSLKVQSKSPIRVTTNSFSSKRTRPRIMIINQIHESKLQLPKFHSIHERVGTYISIYYILYTIYNTHIHTYAPSFTGSKFKKAIRAHFHRIGANAQNAARRVRRGVRVYLAQPARGKVNTVAKRKPRFRCYRAS